MWRKGGCTKPRPAAVLQIVLHSIIIDAVEWTAVLQKGFLHAVNMDTDNQAHPGFNLCNTNTSRHFNFQERLQQILIKKIKIAALKQVIAHLPTGLLWQQTPCDPDEKQLISTGIHLHETQSFYYGSYHLPIIHRLSWHKISRMDLSWTFFPLVIQVMIKHPTHET